MTTIKQEGLICKRVNGEGVCNIERVFRHRNSGEGVEWGHGGSGPDDLALLVCDFIVRDLGMTGAEVKLFKGSCCENALSIYQDFKWRFIATMPKEGGHVPYNDMKEWVLNKLQDVKGNN